MTEQIPEPSGPTSPPPLPGTWTTLPLDDSDWFVPVGVTAFAGRKPYFSTGSIQPSARVPEGEFGFANRPTRANRIGRKWDVLQARMAGADKALIVDESLNDSLFSTGFMQWRPPVAPETLGPWLFYAVQAPDFLAQRDRLASGTTQVALNDGNLSKIVIPIAPLAEQRRIVEAIETRFARLDAAIRALERARANLKRYLVSTLGSAFPEESSAYHFVDLAAVCETATGGTPRRDSPGFYGGTIPWIKSGELRDGLVTRSEEAITQDALDGSNAKVFPAGTVCMALYGATVGKLGILGLDAATNQAVCAFFPHSELNSQYLFWFLRSRRGKLLSNRSGGAQPNISQTIVRHLRVPITSVDQQYALVAEIERRISAVEVASAETERALKRCGRLRESILQVAFQGRLAPHDPNDEPACALLERIKTTSQVTSKPVRRPRRLLAAE